MSTRVRNWVLLGLAVIVVAAMHLVNDHFREKAVRADERMKTLADMARFDSSLVTARERQWKARFDSLANVSRHVDTVLLTRIERVPAVVAQLPEPVRTDPAVNALVQEYETLSQECETCRRTVVALRESMVERDSIEHDSNLRWSAMLLTANDAARAAQREAQRKVSKLECTAYTAGALGLGALLGKAM